MPQMREVIAAALKNSNAIEQRAFVEAEAEGRRMAARAAVKPNFSTSVSFRQEKDEDTVGETSFEERVVYNVVLRHPLFYWGALNSEKRIGEMQFDMEALSSQLARLELVQSIRREYMSLVIAKQRFERVRLDLEEAKSKLDYHLESVEKGLASSSSAFPLELDVERKELSALRIQSDWDYALQGLANQTGIDAESLAGLIADEIPEFELLSPESMDQFAAYFERGVDVDETNKRLALDLEIEKRRLQIIDQSLKPRFDAQVGLSSNALDLDGTRREQSYSYFGLNVGWNIFDGFRKKGRSMEAVNRLMRKEKSKELFEANLIRSFERMRMTLEIELRSLAIEEQALVSLRANLKFIGEQMEDGLASETAFTKRQRDFTNTSINTQNRRIAYLNALSQLAAGLGMDLSVVE